MSFPRLIQRLFQSEGAGEKLNESIMPATYVKADAAQSLTDAQKEQVCDNAGALSESEFKTACANLITQWGGTVPTD